MKANKIKVFLGGTCNNSDWRDRLIQMLNQNQIDYFNPVVKDWTPECLEEEIKQRENSDKVLYVITPKMTGVYSIAEAVDDSNKRPNKTIFCVLPTDDEDQFSTGQLKSLYATIKMIANNGGQTFGELETLAEYLNIISNPELNKIQG